MFLDRERLLLITGIHEVLLNDRIFFDSCHQKGRYRKETEVDREVDIRRNLILSRMVINMGKNPVYSDDQELMVGVLLAIGKLAHDKFVSESPKYVHTSLVLVN